MSDKEIWKVIEDFPRYQVSNMGRVKSFVGSEKILQPFGRSNGYVSVRLSQEVKVKGKYTTKDFVVHRLVAKYFCENYSEDKEVHHKNRIRTDNRADNLECMTKKDHLALHKKLNKAEQDQLQQEEKTAAAFIID